MSNSIVVNTTQGGRLPFRVVYASSELDHQPALELQLSAFREDAGVSQGGGWCTGEFPTYPVELGIHVGTQTTYIDSLVVQVHRYKIPSKCEIFYGSFTPDKQFYIQGERNGAPNPLKDLDATVMVASERAYMRASFRRLGFVSFSDKSDVGFSAQEVKKVSINQHITGEYLFVKFLFHAPFVNVPNKAQQIAIAHLDVRGSKDSQEGDVVMLRRTSDNAALSISELVARIAGSSSATDNVDDILKEYGLQQQGTGAHFLSQPEGCEESSTIRGQKLMRNMVTRVEERMHRAACNDNLTMAKRLKTIKIAMHESLDRAIRMSNRMRDRGAGDNFHGAASDLMEVRKQFNLCAKIVMESGATTGDKALSGMATMLKALSCGARPPSPLVVKSQANLCLLPDADTTKMINQVIQGRKILGYKEKYKSATILSRVAERLTKIAAELPILQERREAAMLSGDYTLAVATAGEIDRFQRWRDDLYQHSEILVESIDFKKPEIRLSEVKETYKLLLEPPAYENKEHTEIMKLKKARESGLIMDAYGFQDYSKLANTPNDALVGWKNQGSSQWMLASQIKLILIANYYYGLDFANESSSESDSEVEEEKDRERDARDGRTENITSESSGAQKNSVYDCNVRNTLLKVARDTNFSVPGKLGVACPISELNLRDSSGMFQSCFGVPAARCFYSRHPSLRAAAVKALESCLLDMAIVETGIKFITLWKATLSCGMECIQDINMQVVRAGFHLLQTVFSNAKGYFKAALTIGAKRCMSCISIEEAAFSLPITSIPIQELIYGLSYVLPPVAKRAGEREYTSTKKAGHSEIEMMCEQFIIWLCAQPHLGPTPVTGQLTRPFDQTAHLSRGRLRLLNVVFYNFGVIHSGGIEAALSYACGPNGLHSPVEGVMMESLDTICTLYRHTGRKIEPYLKNLPGSLQNLLQEAFAEVDVEQLSEIQVNLASGKEVENVLKSGKVPIHVPEYDRWYCKCCDIIKSDWAPWHINEADKYNTSATMLRTLGVPMEEDDMYGTSILGLDEEDMEEGMNEVVGSVNASLAKIDTVEDPGVIRRENVIIYDALVRGECTHPGCRCPEFRYGVRDRRVCRNCKHKNKFHRPPAAKIGLKPESPLQEIPIKVEEPMETAYGRRDRNRAKRKATELEKKKTKQNTEVQKKSLNSKSFTQNSLDPPPSEKITENPQSLSDDSGKDFQKLEKEETSLAKDMNAESESKNISKLQISEQTLADGVKVVKEDGELQTLENKDIKTLDRLERKRLRQLQRERKQITNQLVVKMAESCGEETTTGVNPRQQLDVDTHRAKQHRRRRKSKV